ncbi:type VI secretion system protein TssA [Piscinibacter sp. XHJ-5]|uniref:type VI secretion system protein TssA n=1 Tax=Piscinibacter sp. XHJ-5 TaxID=3037797 RepID=UPI0024529624|nr:type VI secretion system protein TssA [Piscinibacter sp. XHJ-5]
MPDAELESLLSPLAGDAPCGADLEYDPAFLALLQAGTPKSSQQYGDTVIPPQDADWPSVLELARQLAGRTRDLRVAVWLTRSGARIHGLAAAVRGLQLVQGLIERHWDHVHPLLDTSDHNDPTARVNALMPLVHADAGLADLRSASLTGRRGAVTLRDIELAIGRAEPFRGEPVPTEEGVMQGITAAIGQAPEVAAQMEAAFAAAQGIAAALEQRLEATQTPDFTALKKLLQRVAEAGQRATGKAVEGAPATQATPQGIPGGAINSREDAIRALERVCEWIERNEPSNPAPLLIRRSQRLMTKNFIEIIRDLVPEGVNQIEKLAGTQTKS